MISLRILLRCLITHDKEVFEGDSKEMDIIVFDLFCVQPSRGSKFGGGGEYTKTVLKYFSKLYSGDASVVVCYDFDLFIDEYISNIITEHGYKKVDCKGYEGITKYLRSIKCDGEIRFFAGLSYSYGLHDLPSNVLKIGAFHGLRALERQSDKYILKYFNGKALIRESVKKIIPGIMRERYVKKYKRTMEKFDVLVTDSNYSKYSIMVNYPDMYDKKDIQVFYPLTQEIVPYSYQKGNSSERYIMMISANRWIKNSYRAVHAIDNLYGKGFLKGIKTRVYGNAPRTVRDSVKHKEKFMFYDYVSTEELENGYKECDILFFPTLNEGFGNVPMEAMKYGTTCLVSGVCSLLEVYGDSVYYCNPYDIMEMENRLLQATSNKITQEKIKERLNYLYSRQSEDMNKLISLIATSSK